MGLDGLTTETVACSKFEDFWSAISPFLRPKCFKKPCRLLLSRLTQPCTESCLFLIWDIFSAHIVCIQVIRQFALWSPASLKASSKTCSWESGLIVDRLCHSNSLLSASKALTARLCMLEWNWLWVLFNQSCLPTSLKVLLHWFAWNASKILLPELQVSISDLGHARPFLQH